jgi:hypothetical protein
MATETKKKTSTPSVQATKAAPQPESADPLSMMAEALFSLFAGGVPSPAMGGGTTVAPKGGSPFTQMPDQVDVPQRNPFFTAGPDEMLTPFQGPGQTQVKSKLGPMEQEARKAGNARTAAAAPMPTPPVQPQAPTGGPVPVPQPNPQFHDAGTDLRDFGYMLMQMLGGEQGGAGQVPPRNPLFTGGL